MSCLSRRAAFRFLFGNACAAAVAGFLMFGPASAPAWAQSLDSLRASGALGERYDGLLAVRQPSPEANRIAAEVNGQRQAIYRQRAAEQGVPWEQVGRVYARQILDQAAKGTWFLTEQGWVQK